MLARIAKVHTARAKARGVALRLFLDLLRCTRSVSSKCSVLRQLETLLSESHPLENIGLADAEAKEEVDVAYTCLMVQLLRVKKNKYKVREQGKVVSDKLLYSMRIFKGLGKPMDARVILEVGILQRLLLECQRKGERNCYPASRMRWVRKKIVSFRDPHR